MPERTIPGPATEGPRDEAGTGRPARVVVTSPRTDRARTPAAGWNIARDLDEQTELGAVYARSLIRAQLRAALVTCAGVGGVLLALPLLVRVPDFARARFCGVPLPWLLLALGLQPVWVALAARHLRQAERIERDFLRLVDRS